MSSGRFKIGVCDAPGHGTESRFRESSEKQLQKWTHIVGGVRDESAYVDLDFGAISSINSSSLQVGCPAEEVSEKGQETAPEMDSPHWPR